MNSRILTFFLHSLDITNLAMRYKTRCKPWLGFLAAQLFLNRMSAPIGIACSVFNCLSEQNVRYKKFKRWLSNKSKLAGRYEDGKNISSKKLQIKTNLDKAPYFLRYKASITWIVMQYQNYDSFRCPKANFVLQFFHI